MAVVNQIRIVIPKNTVNEGSGFYCTTTYFDRDTKAVEVAATTKWRVDCLTTNTKVLDWTTLGTSVSTHTVHVLSTYNKIENERNLVETKQLSFKTTGDSSEQFIETLTYRVKNIKNYTP